MYVASPGAMVSIHTVNVCMYSDHLRAVHFVSHLVVNIEFLTEFGDLPLMRSDLSAIRNIDPHLASLRNGYIMNITEYQKGELI